MRPTTKVTLVCSLALIAGPTQALTTDPKGRDIELSLIQTLVDLAAAGLGNVRKTDLQLGDMTVFVLSDKGATSLTTFDLDDLTVGVYANPDRTHVVKIDVIDDMHLRAIELMGTVKTASSTATFVPASAVTAPLTHARAAA